MYVSRGRQHYIYNRGQVLSASVLAALLSALLLLSPGTARAVAHVLAENGVTLPANVIRVLDALPTDPTRDTLRRDEEEVGIVVIETDTTLEDEPEPTSLEWVMSLPIPATVPIVSFCSLSMQKVEESTHAALCRADRSCVSPRAPPV